ncbi:hypothetical protein J6590_103150 [Homalodisca vitripennis]|nr:hypothetical protein J6590_069102 [Homalodisca vitripennis]KAG8304063.1 hypothetical protein J6590_103150 [Homalodisca vitripennis]
MSYSTTFKEFQDPKNSKDPELVMDPNPVFNDTICKSNEPETSECVPGGSGLCEEGDENEEDQLPISFRVPKTMYIENYSDDPCNQTFTRELKSGLRDTKKVTALEQYTKRTNLEISGIPEAPSENMEEILKDVGKALDVELTEGQVTTLALEGKPLPVPPSAVPVESAKGNLDQEIQR